MKNLNVLGKDEIYNDFISSLTASKIKPDIIDWYSKRTSEIYKRIDRRNDNLKPGFARKKSEAKTSSSRKDSQFDPSSFQNPEFRTFFHKKDKISWLSRYGSKVKPDYQYMPEEKVKRIELARIFNNFDSDGSNTQELDEFVDMFLANFLCYEEFKPYSDSISPENQNQNLLRDSKIPRFSKPASIDLAKQQDRNKEKIEEFLRMKFSEFYDFVTKTGKLSLIEFIRLSLNKEAGEKFTEYMRKLKDFQENQIKNNWMLESYNIDFIPLNFDKMMKFLSYRALRDLIREKTLKGKCWVQKFDDMCRLFHFSHNEAEEVGTVAQKEQQKLIIGQNNTDGSLKESELKNTQLVDKETETGGQSLPFNQEIHENQPKRIRTRSSRPSITDNLDLDRAKLNYPKTSSVNSHVEDISQNISHNIKVDNISIKSLKSFKLEEGEKSEHNISNTMQESQKEVGNKLLVFGSSKINNKTPVIQTTIQSFGQIHSHVNQDPCNSQKKDNDGLHKKKKEIKEKLGKSIDYSKRLAKDEASSLLETMSHTNYSFTRNSMKNYSINMNRSASGMNGVRLNKIKVNLNYKDSVNDSCSYMFGVNEERPNIPGGKLHNYFNRSLQKRIGEDNGQSIKKFKNPMNYSDAEHMQNFLIKKVKKKNNESFDIASMNKIRICNGTGVYYNRSSRPERI